MLGAKNTKYAKQQQRAELRAQEEEAHRLALQAEREERVRAQMHSEKLETDKIISKTQTQQTSQIATMFTRTASVGKDKTDRDRDNTDGWRTTTSDNDKDVAEVGAELLKIFTNTWTFSCLQLLVH